MTHVVVEWRRPHHEAPGATDGASRIWLDPRMSQTERRSVLTHELVHLEYGHAGCQPTAVERRVRDAAARTLISHEDLAAALPWAMSLEELADDLWVPPLVLRDRLAGLTATERADLAARLPEHHEDGV